MRAFCYNIRDINYGQMRAYALYGIQPQSVVRYELYARASPFYITCRSMPLTAIPRIPHRNGVAPIDSGISRGPRVDPILVACVGE